jgi:3-hydroxyisobutyrate dehydrogenase
MTEQAEALQLSWLGTGRMGAAGARLLASGCDVTVHNRTAARAALLTGLGAKAVRPIAELAGCDTALAALTAPADLISALTGPEGFISGSVSPRIVVDCSTVPAGCHHRG